MVVVHRTVRFVSDKRLQARAWTTKVAKYVRQKYPKHNTRLLRTLLGDVHAIHWISEYESLAEWERQSKELETDKGYQDLMAEDANKGWRIDGSMNLEAYEVLVG